MLNGHCQCGAVRFKLRDSPRIVDIPGLVEVSPSQFGLLEGKGSLATSPNWELCIHCGTGLFQRTEQAVLICASTVPDLMPPVDALHRAAQQGKAMKVRRLLQRGMNANGLMDYQTPWMLASMGGHEEVIQVLREYGARPPRPLSPTFGGQCACGSVRYELVPSIEREVPPETSLPSDERFLSLLNGQLKIVKGERLLRKYGRAPKLDGQHCRRCHSALSLKSPENPNRVYVPLVTVDDCERARTEYPVIGGLPRFADTDLSINALHDAAAYEKGDEVKRLLALGMPVNTKIDGYTPFDWAAGHGKVENCRILLEHGADATTVQWVDYHSPELFRLLLEHGCHPQSFLADTVHHGTIPALRVLLEAGADLNIHDGDEDWTMPLHWSAHNSCAMVRFVIKNGADTTLLSKAGGHALGFCALWGKTRRLQTLLECGFPPNLPQADPPDPALYVACRYGHYKCVRLLLQYGADPNLRMHQTTPLMMAAQQGSLAMVNLLLEHGADPTAQDENGKTAADYAQKGLAERSRKPNDGFRLGTNPAGEPTLRLQYDSPSEPVWTDCHQAIIDRLRLL